MARISKHSESSLDSICLLLYFDPSNLTAWVEALLFISTNTQTAANFTTA
jgi:hypothetical protein